MNKLITTLFLILISFTGIAQIPDTLVQAIPKINVPKISIPKVNPKELGTNFVKKELKIDTTVKVFKNQKTYFKNRIKNKYSILGSMLKSRFDTLKRAKLPPLVKFDSGQLTLLNQISERTGNYPVNNLGSFTRLTFMGNVSVLGLPLKVQLIRTTEQGFLPNQPMNRFTVGLDMVSLEQKIRSGAQSELRKLEKELYLDDMKDLDKLYKFYDDQSIPFLDSKKLNAKLDNYTKDITSDSTLKVMEASAETASKKYIKLAEDSIKKLPKHLQNKAEKKIRNKAKVMQDSVSTKANKQIKKNAKKAEKEKKKLDNYLAKNNISKEKLKNIQNTYDSLKIADPLKIAGYETYAILKAFKDGNTTEGVQKLARYKALGVPEIILGSIKKLEIGTSNPIYSDYTLKGVPIKGVNIELEPLKWHFGYAGTKNMEAIPSQNVYERRLQVAKIGYGKTDASHIRLIYLQGADNKDMRIQSDIAINLLTVNPHKNNVLALKGKVLLSKKTNIEMEAARSFTSINLNKKDLAFNYMFNNFFTDVLIDSTIKIGNAINIKLNTQITKSTKIQLKTEYIDADFFTLGAPYLRNDLKGYQAEVEQTMVGGKLVVGALFGQSYDNVAGIKAQTTFLNTYGGKLKWTPKKLPQILIDYRISQSQNIVTNDVHILNANVLHKYKVNNNNWQSSLIVSINNTQVRYNELGGQNLPPSAVPLYQSAKIYTFNQVFGFSVPLEIQSKLSLRDIQGGVENGFWKSFASEIGYTFKGKWRNSCATNYAYTSDKSKRYDMNFSSEFNFAKYYSIQLKLQRTVMKSPTNQLQNYTENLIVGGLSIKF